MAQRGPISIRRGVPGLLLLAFILPLAAIWIVAWWASGWMLTRLASDTVRDEARLLSQDIDHYLRQKERQLNLVAVVWPTATADERKLLLTRTLHQSVMVHRVYWVENQQVRMMVPFQKGNPLVPEHQPLFSGTSRYSEGYRSPLDGIPVIAIAEPVASGWIILELDLNKFGGTFLPILGETVTMAASGKVLAWYRHPVLVPPPPAPEGAAFATASVDRLHAQIRVTYPPNRLIPIRAFLALGLIPLFLGTLAFALLFYGFIRQSIAVPIKELGYSVRRLASGDLQARADSHGFLEIQELAQNFNRMAESLSASYREVQATSNRLFQMSQISATLRGSLDLAVILPLVVGQTARLIDVSHALIATLAPDRHLNVLAQHGPFDRLNLDASPGSALAEALHRRDLIAIGDLREAPLATPSLLPEGMAKAMIIVPLIARHTPLGVLCLIETGEPRTFSELDLQLVATVANRIAATIDQANLFQAAQASAERYQRITEELELLYDSARALTSSLDPQAVLQQLWRDMTHAVQADACLVFFPQDADKLVAKASNLSAEELGLDHLEDVTIGLESLAGRAFRTGKTQFLSDARDHPELIQPRWHERLKIRAILDVPLVFHGQPQAVVALIRAEPVPFAPRQIALAENIANQAAIALSNARLFEQLQHQGQRLEVVLGSLAEGLLLVAGDRIVQANRSAEQLLGIPAAHLIGRSCEEALGICCPIEAVFDQLFHFQHPGGALLALRMNGVPYDQAGVVITLRDVTHEEAVSLMKSEFISMASHELRTPMTIIRGYVETLMMADEMGIAPDKRRQILGSIRNQSVRLSRIVDDLLSVSRIEAERVPFKPAPLRLEALLTRVRREMAIRAADKRITVRLTLPLRPIPLVWADPDHVNQILTNLIDNAIKYSLPDRLIRLTVSQTGSFVRIGVHDQGIGIPADKLGSIFQKFKRLPSPLSYRERGTGLGLYITRRLAEMQGGVVVAASEPGKGSTFAFTLPIYQPLSHRKAA